MAVSPSRQQLRTNQSMSMMAANEFNGLNYSFLIAGGM